jgi:tetratricopeptide (TPR) repeat protein
MRTQIILATALGLCLVMAGPARADSGGNNSGDKSTPTCNQGEVYDQSTHRCVKAERRLLPDEQLTQYAEALIRAHRYREVLATLDLLQDPNTAVALNYRGYATRRLGHVDEGIGYYLKSVALDPHYTQVREYLGEAYLLKGDLAGAKAQLAAIKSICGTTCDSYQHLAVAIADPADL